MRRTPASCWRNTGDFCRVTATNAPSKSRDSFQSLRAGRLQKLKHLGLAGESIPGRWRLAEGIENTLRRMGERGDIIRTMQRDFSEKGLTRAAGDYVIYDPTAPEARPITGRIVAAAEAAGVSLHRLPLAAMQAIEPRIGEDVHAVLTVERSVKSRTSFGGTAPANVRREARKWLKKLEKEQASRRHART